MYHDSEWEYHYFTFHYDCIAMIKPTQLFRHGMNLNEFRKFCWNWWPVRFDFQTFADWFQNTFQIIDQRECEKIASDSKAWQICNQCKTISWHDELKRHSSQISSRLSAIKWEPFALEDQTIHGYNHQLWQNSSKQFKITTLEMAAQKLRCPCQWWSKRKSW